MKKIIFTTLVGATFALANNNATTITATMNLMSDGMTKIQKGFLLNQKNLILDGINVVENADAIFNTVDVSTFIPNNNKTQVTKNINHNLSKSIKMLKEDVKAGKYADATTAYGKVLSNCISCHTIIRGW